MADRYRGTPTHTVRVDNPLWERGKTATELRQTTISEVVRDALTAFIAETEAMGLIPPPPETEDSK